MISRLVVASVLILITLAPINASENKRDGEWRDEPFDGSASKKVKAEDFRRELELTVEEHDNPLKSALTSEDSEPHDNNVNVSSKKRGRTQSVPNKPSKVVKESQEENALNLQFKLLTPKETKSLFDRAHNGDKGALDEIVKRFFYNSIDIKLPYLKRLIGKNKIISNNWKVIYKHTNCDYYAHFIIYLDRNCKESQLTGLYEGIKSRAGQGNPLAQYSLCFMYLNGNGVDKNDELALKWMMAAAKNGLAAAQHELALQYNDGRLVTKDATKAFKWATKAAEKGGARAKYSLGKMYWFDRAQEPQHKELAIKWFRAASDLGLIVAKDMLLLIYADKESGCRDPAEAYKINLERAELGSKEAQMHLGLHYRLGYGVDKDYAQAMKWFRAAADQGFGPAIRGLGLMYRLGKTGSEPNYAEAMRWYILGMGVQRVGDAILYKETEPKKVLAEPHESRSLARLCNLTNRFLVLEHSGDDYREAINEHFKASSHANIPVAPVLRDMCVSLRQFTNQLVNLSRSLQSCPVLVTSFEFSEQLRASIHQQLDPSFFHVYEHRGKRYYTIGDKNVAKINSIDQLLNPVDVFALEDGLLDIPSYLAAYAQSVFARKSNQSKIWEDDIHDKALATVENLTLHIDSIGQAKNCIDLITASYLRAVKINAEKDGILAAILGLEPKEESEGTLKLKRDILYSSAGFLLRELSKFKELGKLLTQTEAEIHHLIENVAPRNNACHKEGAYETIRETYMVRRYTDDTEENQLLGRM